MKLVEGFVLKNIADTFVVVPLGTNTVNFRSIISLNESGAFLWSLLENDKTEEELVSAMLKEYNTDEKTAREDIASFIENLKKADLLR